MTKRRLFTALLVPLWMLAMAPAASAHVHRVSQAGCAPVGVLSGARMSAHAVGEPGRPAPQIPVTASEGRTQGKGGNAPAQGVHC